MKLLELPNLSWVAMSGNPFMQHVKLAEEAKQFKLKVLDDIPEGTGDILGEGAGGITRKVIWKDHQPVAVKTFCGAMTSDGSPEAERQMALTISYKINDHDHLIDLFGETPNGALVMEYLDNYQALAGPPSMETCSRDVYPSDRDNKHYMTEPQALSMVTGLLDVLDHLHAHGICHGDFYAHNILVSDQDRGQVKLSDFGAAFFYDHEADYGKPLERTELRAFSHLVDEVREHFADEKQSLFQDLASACREATASFAKVNAYWKETCK